MDARALQVSKPLLPESGVDSRAQDDGVERFGEVVVGALLDAADDAVRLVDGRDHDHRHVLRAGRCFQLLEDGDAIELRHDDVEKDDVARLLAEELQRLPAVRRSANRVTVLLEEASEQLSADAVVVGNEDRRGHVVRVILASPRAAVNRVHHIAPSAWVGRTI